tara:strand:- start:211 stop:720 length:510 start_codon:yes stop_codon:yes gene_type:complete
VPKTPKAYNCIHNLNDRIIGKQTSNVRSSYFILISRKYAIKNESNHCDYTEDKTLVSLVAKGDIKAFGYLYDREVRSVYKLAFIYVKEKASAEDATQEIFSKLWVHAKTWQADAKLRTWLLSMTRNLCIDLLRKKKNNLKKMDSLYQDKLTEYQLQQTPNFEKNWNKST